MKQLIMFAFCALLYATSWAQEYYLVNKATGEETGPFLLNPGSEIKVGTTLYTVAAKNQATAVFTNSAEQVLNAYLTCQHWEDRIPLVVDGDKTSPAMRQYYGTGGFQPSRYFTIGTNATALPSDKQARVFTVNLSGSASRYVVRRTPVGFRVDWLASQVLWREDEEEQKQEIAKQSETEIRQKYSLSNAVFQVKVERVEQVVSYTVLHIKVTNASKAFIGYWSVTAAIYDNQGKYLGQALTNGQNLQPGSFSFSKINFADVRAHTVAKWTLKLDRMIIETSQGDKLPDGEKYFGLEEVK